MNARLLRNAAITLSVLASAGALSALAKSETSPSEIDRHDLEQAVQKFTDVTVSDINDRGRVVGTLTKWDDSATRGFVWRKGAIRLLGRGRFAEAGRINERGQVVGTSGDNQHGVVWENGKARKLGLTLVWGLDEAGRVIGGNLEGNDTDGYLPAPALWENGIVRSLPFALGHLTVMNNREQVAGEMPDGNAAEWRDGELTDLGAGEPIAINDHGEILGSRGQDVIVWRDGVPADIGRGSPVALNEQGQAIVWNPPRALLWRNGTMTDLGTLGGNYALPTAISDSGQVVGVSADSRGRQRGFVWQDGAMIRLPTPPGYAGSVTRAIAINDHNQIVGDNCVVPCGEDRSAPGSKFAVRWTLRGDKIETQLLLSRHRFRQQPWPPAPRAITVSAVSGAAHLLGRRSVRNGHWIAYSTAPPGNGGEGCGQPPPFDRCGSDVFVTRAGGRPQLVSGRSGGMIWNLCPAFSPNGRMLAFARVTRHSRKAGAVKSTIVVVRFGLHGPVSAGRRVLKVRGELPRCPRWSSNSSRLAYLDRRRVVVLGLDGSRPHRSAGDPTAADFTNKAKLVSPTGDLIASQSPYPSYTIVVSRRDGSARRIIPDDPPSYAIAGWSPDGHKLLLMRDVGGGFRMRAVSVDLPEVGLPFSETVVAFVPVNNARSWPGYGDVSWQPMPRG